MSTSTSKPADAQTVPGADIVYPEAKMHLYRPNEPVIGRITRNEICTRRKAAAFTRHIEFDVSGTALEGVCLPGQSIGVVAPGQDSKGRPHAVRLYSLASPTAGEDGEGKILSTTVKRTIDEHWETHKLFLGVASNYLCDLSEGDEVRLSGPNGKRFLLPTAQGEHDYVFVATGTGIAPFRGMVLDLLRSGSGSRVVLIQGVPYASDLMYHDLFLKLEQEHENFTYVTAVSRERQHDGHDAMYVDGRLRTHEELLLPILAGERTLVYVCGIAGMELGLFKQMARRLPEQTLDQYLRIDRAVAGEIDNWTGKMINRAIKPTKRVHLEVYA